jgi:hypothetical protein
MDARQVERPVPEMTKTEALDEKIKSAISSLERVEELNERSINILNRLERRLKGPMSHREGICPMCGQVWDA